jgi:formate--tetrahydrofolate ligase
MAIVALAHDQRDLRRRLDSIVIGADRDGHPIRGQQLNATGAMMALLADAIHPNLVQTTDGTPALVHTGPFGNIAPGTSSVISQDIGLRLADYVVNEVGFGSELGAEKYFDIVMQQSGIVPSAAVLVTTVAGIRNQGEGHLNRGLPNLGKHIEILRSFGVPIVAAINAFPGDSAVDLKYLADFCVQQGIASAVSEAFTKGGSGAKELAECVLEVVAANSAPLVRPIYSLDAPLTEKIRCVANKIYGAADVSLSEQAKSKLDRFGHWGGDRLPICVAKTQYSLSDNPKLLGRPSGFKVHISRLKVSAGAEFIVAYAGEVLTMPGLSKNPAAQNMDVFDDGRIIGLY